MKAEVKVALHKGNIGWKYVVLYKKYVVTYHVLPDGSKKRISWTDRWDRIPEADRDAIWKAVQSEWDRRNRDRFRAVRLPPSPGESHD